VKIPAGIAPPFKQMKIPAGIAPPFQQTGTAIPE
jgi:hypothetical protein